MGGGVYKIYNKPSESLVIRKVIGSNLDPNRVITRHVKNGSYC